MIKKNMSKSEIDSYAHKLRPFLLIWNDSSLSTGGSCWELRVFSTPGQQRAKIIACADDLDELLKYANEASPVPLTFIRTWAVGEIYFYSKHEACKEFGTPHHNDIELEDFIKHRPEVKMPKVN